MNYQNIYDSLIKKRKLEPLKEGYFEKHHILPKCMGGDDSPENVVNLSAREHYIAHALLYHIHRNSKMAFAWFSMCRKSKNQVRNITSKQYEMAKQKVSKTMKEKTGPKNSFFGKKHSENTKQKLREKNKGKKKSKSQIENWVEKVAKKPKTKEHRRKISKPGYLMLKNIKTGESIRVLREEREQYDKDIWKNPSQISQRKDVCIYCGIKTIAGMIERWHNENCKHKKT